MNRSSSPKPLRVRWLGQVPYGDSLALQDSLVRDRRGAKVEDTLLLLEHPPVVTLGRGADRRHVLLDARQLAASGIELYETGRGGDVTYHGPGQIVGYPIVALSGQRRDAHRYLRDLEEALILAVADWGVSASRAPGLTGVWACGRKLAAIGVRVSTGWITSHGFALNVTTDLSGFRGIVPCGISGRGVTSMAEILGRAPALTDVASCVAVRTARQLGFSAVPSRDPSERLPLPRIPNSRVAALGEVRA